MAEDKYITVKGARVNNLKNIDLRIPRDKLIVITGVSGSGKSSLAFDTLYAAGQRRYGESLSSYARQFLGRLSKPDCDFITVEQTGGGAGMLDPVQLDIDCWSSKRKGGRKRARAVARLVEAAVLDLDEEPNIFHPTVENTYRLNDPDTGRPRYVVQAQVWVCE